jgi:Condensation domain
MRAEPKRYAPPIRRRDPLITQPPLSFAQQRLWFIEQLDPGNVAYNIPLGVKWVGPLNLAVFEKCVSEIVSRHETLRTTFANVGGEPVQVISPPAKISLPVVDLSRASEVDHARRTEVKTSFDLAKGPLWRVKLLRLAAEEHVVLFTLHHSISDAWSLNVLVREMVELYTAFSRGHRSPLDPLPVQYADFAIWQRAWLQGDVLQSNLDYWRKQLNGAPTRLELPTDRPYTQSGKREGALHSFTIPLDITAKLKEIARREEATLFMVLLAGFAALLSRYSGQEDMLIGTAIAGRQRAELEKLIGFFVNTLVIRMDLRRNPSFRELVTRVRETMLGAYAHQDVPFEKLVEELQPERSLSNNPLFQVLMVMQNLPRGKVALEGLQLEWLEVEEVSAKFDLTLVAAEVEKGMQCTFLYSTDLFDGPTVAQMADRYEALLRDAAHGRYLALSNDKSRELATAFNAPLE